ncbi:MAG: hypothetical protein WBD15_00680 [Pseudolabrys sp.]
MAMSAIMRHEAADDRLLVAGTIACLAISAALLHFFAPINHDEAYFMALAGRLLDGGQFGKDIMDMNPPHVWWISAMPVWLARQTGFRLDVAAAVFTVTMAVLSVAAVARLTAAAGLGRAPRSLFLVFATLLVLFIPGYDFGQREHWMVLLTLPYIVARGCRLNNSAVSPATGAAIGVAAALGFCIKPYFLLVPVALEVWILARTRRPSLSIRPETMAMAIAGIVYGAFTLTYARSYLEIEVPTALLGYWSYNSPMQEVLRSALILLAPAAMLLGVGYLTRQQGAQIPALAQALAVAGAASCVAALIQAKPWAYHFLPGIVFLDLSAVILLTAENPRVDRLTPRRIAFAILVVMAVVPTAFEAVRAFEGASSRIDQLAATFRSNPGPNRSVFGFITSPRDVFPAVVAAEMEWAAPFCCEYLIAATARVEEAPAAYRPKIRAAGMNQAEMAVSAVRTKEPGVIVIATGNDMLGFNHQTFDYVAWLSAHTDFASILAHYREISPIGSFRIFVRK